MEDTPLIIGSRTFNSRLLVGTGKYKDLTETDQAIQASGAEIVTVAIRRVNIGQHPDQAKAHAQNCPSLSALSPKPNQPQQTTTRRRYISSHTGYYQ